MALKAPTVIICLSPYSGGMEIDTIKLAKKLSPYAPIIVIAKKGYFIDQKKSDYEGYNNIVLETLSFKSSLSYSLISQIRQLVLKYDIKNVVFFGASELKSLYFAFLGLNINLIVRHGTTKSKPKKDWFHRLIYSNVNYHVAICKHLAQNVQYIIPFGEKTQLRLIYSSFSFAEPVHNEHQKLTLLHVGRIADGKGQTDAIQACKTLIDNNVDFELNLIGGLDETYKDTFFNFYDKCSYKDKINLIGFTDDVQAYLHTADVFLFPSYGEGLSNAFLEALANNIVCMAYNNTSFPELRDLGLYFEMAQDRDIIDLQAKLLDTVLHLSEKKQQAECNSILVKKLFSLTQEINSYLEILK